MALFLCRHHLSCSEITHGIHMAVQVKELFEPFVMLGRIVVEVDNIAVGEQSKGELTAFNLTTPWKEYRLEILNLG